jgi:hypothetical protein
MAVQIRKRYGRHLRPDIHSDYSHPFFIQVKKSWSSPTWGMTISAFCYPPFRD